MTSAVKDVFTTFNAAPRAINMVRRRVTPGTSITGVDATENGTPLVYYSPAVTTVSTTATIEMTFDDYPDELVSRIGNAISTAGGIPLFGPYGPVMIGVGLAIKLVSTSSIRSATIGPSSASASASSSSCPTASRSTPAIASCASHHSTPGS